MEFIDLTSGHTIKLSAPVVAHFKEHMQVNEKDKEAGGQLFARVEGSQWFIERASGPFRQDTRSRFGFKPNRKREQKEIDLAFENGLHFVGDWHSHPEPVPTPSGQDRCSILDLFKNSEHQLEGFLMIIVGNNSISDLWVSLHSTSSPETRLILKQ
ncbi:Mov34/MPN/PAD-1 family protein [Alteromonas sp. R78001]|uniref:Mov34/MPN/PAD-1 family protein n=1 Tax=Alteromonas sp. R78001 TaxID=3093865 RepID=UPI00366CFB8D